ncbi:MAG: phosphate ABC transporter permease subunit PstC [Anaerolineae bacterium]|nr:phosphate ABC transporter permease subunit PstC [Anaerolineae bacterium]
MQIRRVVDRSMTYLLLFFALVSILIVFLIGIFTIRESLEAWNEVGLLNFLIGTSWHPTQGELGILQMIIGSILATFGSLVLGVPLAFGCAIFLAEIAPQGIQRVLRPAIQLLAGIPSVVFGLFGLVVLVPAIRKIQIYGNSGFSILAASIVLAVMILPTIASITEDAIRAVPRSYKEGSLALGATHWQTIVNVILPAARPGIVAAVILGVGRALGETMAMIMVIGNSVAMPRALDPANPLTIFLSQARTLTGNVAVEISYATGVHESGLFATGVVLFVLIMLVNSGARALIRAGGNH